MPDNVPESADRITSSFGVEVALHDLGGSGTPLLLSHATGFHGRCWQPVADALAHRFHSVAFDYRGHGDSYARDDSDVDWEHYGDDALAVARTVVDRSGGPVLAVGHSMGGACLLMAAYRDPSLFRGLVLFEPIVMPTELASEADEVDVADVADTPASSLAIGARRRRSSFPSVEAAIANYASKPPMNHFTPAALAAYVEHGFRRGDDGEVHLKCSPEHEARTFESGGVHRTWDALPAISTPTWVVPGGIDPFSPARFAEPVAQRLPHSTYVEMPDLDHFGPMTHPERIADLVILVDAELGSRYGE